MVTWAFLLVGGLAGTAARYLLAGAVYARVGAQFPYGTLAVNLAGCFIVGFLDVLAEKKFLLGPNLRVLLMTGFCGAFTTFSTFMLETVNLLKGGEYLSAATNVFISVIAGLVVFMLGGIVGKIL